MSYTPEQAKIMGSTLIADFENEMAATKRIIGAIPAGKESYAPDSKNMTAIDLAWHIARVDAFLLNGVAEGQFVRGSADRPAELRTGQDIVAWYDKNVPAAVARVKGLSGEQLAKTVDFFGVMQLPAANFVLFTTKHCVHHRGQLSAYLRPMGAKVPAIYGQSADTK